VFLLKQYDAEFRGEVLAACDTNEERRVIALRFNVSESWLRRIQQQRRETGQIAPKKAAARLPKWHAWSAWLVAKIVAQPDIYLRELQAELKRERGEDVCLGTICAACHALEQSRKKRRWLPASRIDRMWSSGAWRGARRRR
jgi:transposase